MEILSDDWKHTFYRMNWVDYIARYAPVILVAAIISSESCGLHFVFFPLYFKDSLLLRFICTTPIYMGIILLSWSWYKAIFNDAGIIMNVCFLQ